MSLARKAGFPRHEQTESEEVSTIDPSGRPRLPLHHQRVSAQSEWIKGKAGNAGND